MLVAEVKNLIRRLSRVAMRSLEAAVTRAVSGRDHEVTSEHFLDQLIDDRSSEVVRVLEHHAVDVGWLRRRLNRAMLESRADNLGKPVFAPALCEWLQDAWLFGSLDQDATKIRSSALITVFVLNPSRYATTDLAELFEGLDKDALKKGLAAIVAGSAEEAEARPAPPRPAPAPSAAGAEPRETVLYRVSPGDTLAGIARELAVDVEAVAHQNKLRLGVDPVPGTFLRIRALPRVIAALNAPKPIAKPMTPATLAAAWAPASDEPWVRFPRDTFAELPIPATAKAFLEGGLPASAAPELIFESPARGLLPTPVEVLGLQARWHPALAQLWIIGRNEDGDLLCLDAAGRVMRCPQSDGAPPQLVGSSLPQLAECLVLHRSFLATLEFVEPQGLKERLRGVVQRLVAIDAPGYRAFWPPAILGALAAFADEIGAPLMAELSEVLRSGIKT